MADSIELTKMVRTFRVTDLQALLGFAGRNKIGKKSELQARALELITIRSGFCEKKIRELYRQKYHSRGHSDEADIFSLPPPINDPVMNYVGVSAHSASLGDSGMSRYVSSINKHMMPPPSHIFPQYPVNPDIKFKVLPFYDVLGELLKPTSVVFSPNDRFPDRDFSFCFTPQQVLDLHNSDLEVQFRMCVLDTSCEQDDEIPAQLSLKVNHLGCTLPNVIPTNRPGVEAKRPKVPVDITPQVKKTAHDTNAVQITYSCPNTRAYAIAIYVVRKLNASVLMQRLKENGVKNPDHTTAIIKEKLCQDRDSEIATMSLRGSLMCPLGKIKMKYPCRASTCTHLQCFDSYLYLQMNEKKPKWICPVCDKPAQFKTLAIDGLFLDIIWKAPDVCTEVQFHENGSWTPVMPVKKPEVNEATIDTSPKVMSITLPKVQKEKVAPKKPIEVISLDSDSDTEEDPWPIPPKKKIFKPTSEMSPVLIDSPEYVSSPEEALPKKYESTDSSSKSASVPQGSAVFPNIPNKDSLAPLPTELEIDTSDVDSIFMSPASGSGASSSNYGTSSQKFHTSLGTSFPETVEVMRSSQTSNKTFTNFNLYNLIHEDNPLPPSTSEEGSNTVTVIDIE